MNLKALHLLSCKAYRLRQYALKMTTLAGSGHPSSCLSAADLVAAVFFYAMRYDPQNFDNPNNDHFILSKGHAAPLLYAAWEQVGVIPESLLWTYRSLDSVLEGHPTRRFAYTQAATGSLGIGLSIGAGMSKAALMDKRINYTYVLMGDGEIAEGSIWEAAEIAAFYKLHNLIGIVDCNRLGQSTESLHDHHVARYAEKFKAFGWQTFIINGHDLQEIITALDQARHITDKPTMIIAKTYKGYGVTLFEDKQGWHGKALDQEQLKIALQELAQNFPQAATCRDDIPWKAPLPSSTSLLPHSPSSMFPLPHYVMDESIATRKAYGQALEALGSVDDRIVALDGDVKNSTFSEFFEKVFPERFVECFIAEQNMVSMGVGFAQCGKIPFIATFAAFLMRAADQIRMAAISKSPLRLVGSHVGVSIGQDGPSQMGLEDIAFMRTLPDSIILYPSDAVSAYKLVGLMAHYYAGISYLRTTRAATPVIYSRDEEFVLGGCKVVRQSNHDAVCVIAAGITLHEALKAYDQLSKEGIPIAVIDLYSVKPLDVTTLMSVIKKSNNRVIIVEDHYLSGGLGQAVLYELRALCMTSTCLAVTELPRSGKPEELLAWAGIDAAAIVSTVKAMGRFI